MRTTKSWASGATPTMPSPLRPRAAAMPATWVAWLISFCELSASGAIGTSS